MDTTPRDDRFTRLDRRIITGGLCICFAVAPLLPTLVHVDAAFAIRSFILLALALIAGRCGLGYLAASFKRIPVLIPALITLLVMGLTLFYSPDVYSALDKWTTCVTLFLLVLVVLHAPLRECDTRYLVLALVAGAVISAALALQAQWSGHGETITQIEEHALYDEAMKTELIRSLEANRALGRFGNPNHLAGYLVLSLWGVWWLARTPRRTGWPWGLLLCSGVLIACIYQTYSRSGLLALVVTAMALSLWELNARGWRISWRWLGAGVLALAACIGLLLVLLPADWFGGRLMTLSTVIARWHFFRGALEILQDHPWLGVGLEGFEGHYSQVLRPGDLESRYVHNWLLEGAVEGGGLLLVPLVWTLTALVVYLVRFIRQNPGSVTAAACSGCWGILLLLSSIDFHNRLFELWLPVVLFSGLLGRTRVNESPVRLWKPLTIVLVTLMLLFWSGLVLGRFINEQARQNGYGFTLEEQFPQARNAYRWAVTAAPYDAESWKQLGLLWRNVPTMSALQRSLTCMEQAVAWAPRRASFRIEYAETLFAAGFVPEALKQMDTALDCFPSRADNYRRAATLYEAAGETGQADILRAEAERIQALIEETRP